MYKSTHLFRRSRRRQLLSSCLISPTELAGCIDDPGVVVLDCRFDLMQPDAGRQAWLESHVPGAVYADLDRDLAAPLAAGSGRHPLPDPVVTAERFGAMGIGSGSSVVVYDASSGAIAARAWWLLRWIGHDDVAVLDGGIDAWVREQLPVECGAPRVVPAELVARPRETWVLTTEDILRMGDSRGRHRLVDARDPARFRGEREPIDPVAGRIPGTRNLPFAESIGTDGCMKPPGELRRLIGACLDGDFESEWGVMCGSGVTACHLVLAAELAGVSMPRVYVGSYSEWISDPGRPVAKGPVRSGE